MFLKEGNYQLCLPIIAFSEYVKKRHKPLGRFFLSGIGSLNSIYNIIKSKKQIKNISNLYIWPWDWHFYHSSLHIDRRIIFWILKNLSTWLYGTLWKEPQKFSVTKIYSVGFSHHADFDNDHYA